MGYSQGNDNDLTFIGRCNFRDDRRIVGIKQADRRQHMYVVGKTGTGKSTTLFNMIVQDIANGRGIGLVDPHGDLAERILEYVPPHRYNDVIYFNPADFEYPIGLNVLEGSGNGHAARITTRNLIASSLVSVFKKLWSDSWGPRLEHFLRNAVLALLDSPGSTLLGLFRMFVDQDYRNQVVLRVRDPLVRMFWEKEFPSYGQQFRAEASGPILNKVGQFLSSSIVRNIVGQRRSTLKLDRIMNERKILIANLSKGRLGEDNSALLGALLVSQIQLKAMDRITIPEDERPDFHLYVDEFHNFATESFVVALSEARKFHLSLVLAHQYLGQLPEGILDAVLGNAGTLMSFRLGVTDSTVLQQEYAPVFSDSDLLNLDNYTAYLKPIVDGIPRTPFSLRTLPAFPPRGGLDRPSKIIRLSRERHASRRLHVEQQITTWVNPLVS